jgi:RecA-family ATPase
LAEGIATALTIWRAYNKEITVISFGSITNLQTVVSRIKTKYPETELIICLDYGTAAFKGAHDLDQEYPNLKYCTPSFEGLSYQEEKKPTDFNDLISQCNLKDLDVQKQLEKTITIHEIPKEPQNEILKQTNSQSAKPTTIKDTNIQFLCNTQKDFFAEKAPEIQRLISLEKMGCSAVKSEPFLVRGIVGSVIGAGGIGKTHYLTQLALAVASGCKFLNEYNVEKQETVIYFYGEEIEASIHRLIHKTYQGNYKKNKEFNVETTKQNFAFQSVRGTNASFLDRNGSTTDFYQETCKCLESIANKQELGLTLIILDPVSRFLGPDAEKDNAQATAFIALLEKLTTIKGNPTVLFGHHMSKAGYSSSSTDQSASRGSSALTDGVRWQINLDRVIDNDNTDRSHINQKMTKSNYTRIFKDQLLFKSENGCLSIENKQSQSDISATLPSGLETTAKEEEGPIFYKDKKTGQTISNIKSEQKAT